MTLKKALAMVDREYEKAKENKYVRKPLAYALYKVWRLVDAEESEKDGD